MSQRLNFIFAWNWLNFCANKLSLSLIVPVERKCTAFEANGRLFQFKGIPFGVTNGGVCFQRMTDKLIQKEHLNDTFCYTENLTVGGHLQEQHDDNVKKTYGGARALQVHVEWFEGNQVSEQPDPDRLQAFQTFPCLKIRKSQNM